MMLRALVLCGVVIAMAGAAEAQQLTVRSGEHETFSRLVIPFPRGTTWSLTQNSVNATLSAEPDTFRYNMDRVFNLIPKNRITSVQADGNSSKIIISMSGTVHAKAFQLAGGAVVIDIVDGVLPDSGPLSTSVIDSVAMPDHMGLYWRSRKNAVDETDAATETPSTFRMPDERIAASERQLLENLSRAAAQGLVGVDLTRLQPRQGNAPNLSPPQNPIDVALALRSQTVIDRDLGLDDRYAQVLSRGNICPSDANFQVESWRSNDDAFGQISKARTNLVAEFDTPRPVEIERLAKTYLSLGFGAEAKAVLRSFASDDEMTRHLRYIADVIEEISPEEGSVSSGMAACSGKVALWAFLGSTKPIPADEVNLSALQQAFSALPRDLREALGPKLVRKLLDAGADGAANAVENVLRRTDRPGQIALPIAEAEIALNAGRPQEVELRLQSALSSRDARSAKAVALSVEARLQQNQAIDRPTLDNVAALAHQVGDSEAGRYLRRVQILGEGSVGRFDEAFILLDSKPSLVGDDLKLSTRNDLLMLLARVPDDVLFTSQVLKRLPTGAFAELTTEQQLSMSRRLSDLGFATAAFQMLSPAVRRAPSGRLQLARAALANMDGAASLAHIDTLDGDNARELRASALAMLGEHRTSAELYDQMGDAAAAAREAWRGEQVDIIERHGSQTEKAAVSGLTWESGTPEMVREESDNSSGLLGRSIDLIDSSQRDREIIERLLRNLP